MKTVLFVCVHNAGRSQMAEAFFNRLAAGRARAISAGTMPAERVHPEVVEAMAEVGIDLSRQKPKLLTPEMIEEASRIITMGCSVEEVCPAVFVPSDDWELEDPKGQSIEKVRAIRDEIRRRVEALVEEMG
ncbi:MAG TPA: arsenate reductase ArsC [Chloroflexi bacterium]|nr:arsenate reductase ArsC [Chloroflexota bacterium]